MASFENTNFPEKLNLKNKEGPVGGRGRNSARKKVAVPSNF